MCCRRILCPSRMNSMMCCNRSTGRRRAVGRFRLIGGVMLLVFIGAMIVLAPYEIRQECLRPRRRCANGPADGGSYRTNDHSHLCDIGRSGRTCRNRLFPLHISRLFIVDSGRGTGRHRCGGDWWHIVEWWHGICGWNLFRYSHYGIDPDLYRF